MAIPAVAVTKVRYRHRPSIGSRKTVLIANPQSIFSTHSPTCSLLDFANSPVNLFLEERKQQRGSIRITPISFQTVITHVEGHLLPLTWSCRTRNVCKCSPATYLAYWNKTERTWSLISHLKYSRGFLV